MGGYAITKKLGCGYAEAVEKAREALAEEGFGILTEIDVKATLKKKLDKEFRNYIILGACNPPYAYQALTAELEIGLMMPCNVIVYENDDEGGGGSTVSAIDPVAVMGAIDNPELATFAEEVRAGLEKALSSLG
ncbi:MAG: DUF302 domain-containing protein [Thermodesulfobacteriota bacterium]